MPPKSKQLPIVVLISGSGSNLQAIIDSIACGDLNAKIKSVISNKQDAYGLQRARHAGINTQFLNPHNYPNREQFDLALIELIEEQQAGLVVLAGYMRILSDVFVNHFHGKLINIHPSLLPEYKGLNTHQRVIDDNATQHGATVHFVVPALDSGPLLLQARIPVNPQDSAMQLSRRVLEQEHIIYPIAIQWFAQNRIHLTQQHLYFDKHPLKKPIIFPDDSQDDIAIPKKP